MQLAINDLKFDVAQLSLTQRLTSRGPRDDHEGFVRRPLSTHLPRRRHRADRGDRGRHPLPRGALAVRRRSRTRRTRPTRRPCRTPTRCWSRTSPTPPSSRSTPSSALPPPPACEADLAAASSAGSTATIQKEIVTCAGYIPDCALGTPPPIPPASPIRPARIAEQRHPECRDLDGDRERTSSTSRARCRSPRSATKGALYDASETVADQLRRQADRDLHGGFPRQHRRVNFQTLSTTLSGTKPIAFTGLTSGCVAVSSFEAIPFCETTYEDVQADHLLRPARRDHQPAERRLRHRRAGVDRPQGRRRPAPTSISILSRGSLGLPDRANTVASVRLYDAAIPATPTLSTPTTFTLPEPLAISGVRSSTPSSSRPPTRTTTRGAANSASTTPPTGGGFQPQADDRDDAVVVELLHLAAAAPGRPYLHRQRRQVRLGVDRHLSDRHGDELHRPDAARQRRDRPQARR